MTLLDSSACINLMPLSTLMRVGDVEVKPTRMTLQLVDHSFKYPHGLVGNILMKVGKLSFLVDFVVTDMAANSWIPIVLGWPFMKTVNIVIDVGKGDSNSKCRMRMYLSMSLTLWAPQGIMIYHNHSSEWPLRSLIPQTTDAKETLTGRQPKSLSLFPLEFLNMAIISLFLILFYVFDIGLMLFQVSIKRWRYCRNIFLKNKKNEKVYMGGVWFCSQPWWMSFQISSTLAQIS